jgi:hypothetical protein
MNPSQHDGPFIALAHAYRDLEDDERKLFSVEKLSDEDLPKIQEDSYTPTTLIENPRHSSVTKSSILNLLDAGDCKHLHQNFVESTC